MAQGREPRPDDEGFYSYRVLVRRPNETVEYVHRTKRLVHENEALPELGLTVFQVARHPRHPEPGLVHARPSASI